MAEVHGGMLLARQLQQDGIDTVFGVLAGPMQHAFQALDAIGIRVVGTRHEEQAAFMAQAWGFLRGRAGIVITGSGPGTLNAVPAMHVAAANGWPLVVLGGSTATRERGVGGFQECDQIAYAAPSTKWIERVDAPDRIPEMLHIAIGRAEADRPGAVYLDFPAQVMWSPGAEAVLDRTAHSPRIFRSHPDPAGVATIADAILAARKPLLIVGKGATWQRAGDDLTLLADLGIPFVADPMAKGTIPDDHPACAGAARSQALAGADLVVMIGGRFDWMFSAYHRVREERLAPTIIQIVTGETELHDGVPVDIGMVAAAGPAAKAIAAEIERRGTPAAWEPWQRELAQLAATRTQTLHDRPRSTEVIDHHTLWRTVAELADRDAIIVTDGEATAGVGRIAMPAQHPATRLDPGTSSCMGVGVPYAIGAKLAQPDRQVVAVLGDYAFGASALEVETAQRLGLDVTFIVDNNAGIVGEYFQQAWFGPNGQPIASLLPARYDTLATMVGAHGLSITHPDELAGAIRSALDRRGVSVVNVFTDRMDHGLKRGSGWATTGYAFSENTTMGY